MSDSNAKTEIIAKTAEQLAIEKQARLTAESRLARSGCAAHPASQSPSS